LKRSHPQVFPSPGRGLGASQKGAAWNAWGGTKNHQNPIVLVILEAHFMPNPGSTLKNCVLSNNVRTFTTFAAVFGGSRNINNFLSANIKKLEPPFRV